jgi:predicted enzyme related to lactoylglutathione lyase
LDKELYRHRLNNAAKIVELPNLIRSIPMHHSRLAGFIIDCLGSDLSGYADFWSGALGLKVLGEDGSKYIRLDGAKHGLTIEVQTVEHESRVHLDLETDDIDAEVARLEKLGAVQVNPAPRWTVMQAPSGQRFCVVKARENIEQLPGTTRWP